MGGKAKDLSGMKFGRLTVVERQGSDKHRQALWLCKCECGNEVVVKGYCLKNGHTTSCGCYNREKAEERIKDLTGKKFGRLTVVERCEKDKGGAITWLCKCECGNEVVISGTNLRCGRTKSCGCYQREIAKEQWKNEEHKQKHINGVKEKLKDEEYRQMKSDKAREQIKEMWEDEEYRQMRSEVSSRTLKEIWKNEEYRQMKSDKMREIAYKGGITLISDHLRHLPLISQWRKDTYIRENSRCQLTHKEVHGGNSDIHHLYGFNMIVLEAHELHNIQIKPHVKDYTEEELHKLEKYVEDWHKDTSNAVLLSREVHILFHSLYKSGNNTPEQFEEFRERYMAGEFDDLI